MTPAVLSAQTPKWELGTKLGVTYAMADGVDIISAGVPGGGPFTLTGLLSGSPSVFFGFFPSINIALLPEVGFALTDISIDGFGDASLWSLVVNLQAEYHLSTVQANSPYIGINGAWQHVDLDGESDSDFALGAALGYRFLPHEFMAFAAEIGYRRWFDFEISEIHLSFSMAVVVN
jgi:hypothetical protein